MTEDSEATKPQGGEIAVEEGADDSLKSEVPPSPSPPPAISLNIWPPSQRARDAVIHRLIDTLSSPSVLTKRYCVVPEEMAAATARIIEQEAFDAANSGSGREVASIDEGLAVLQIYSKDISKRMMDFLKSKPLPASSAPTTEEAVDKAVSVPAESATTTESAITAAGGDEEASSVEQESASIIEQESASV
ncbi:MFP1 attachment factor 1-like [Zingiber officinale]|uniref:WPP domain-containing protein n=1 Tax=Zingiber officinale TaxID=94328 RepID=A0A8J5C3R7_ZINOF|nr:MFP1 attachment factor 1-like [Zingiber officinale]KAG6470368.1 hypothetical protein ZIOFF_071436 [Zingiber officinale]